MNRPIGDSAAGLGDVHAKFTGQIQRMVSNVQWKPTSDAIQQSAVFQSFVKFRIEKKGKP
jgi:hypothetical protein